jgi:hypothetical protein
MIMKFDTIVVLCGVNLGKLEQAIASRSVSIVMLTYFRQYILKIEVASDEKDRSHLTGKN